ncbi:MAG: beta-galactosidase [Saprospiraceae bacterium]|nr:beta-galactosidase [Saprospiraceae bacterium]
MKTLALLLVLLPSLLLAQRPQSAEIRLLNGQPTLYVNQQPELPFMYALTHVTGGRWSWEELPAHNLRRMGEAGIRLFQVDLWLEDIWKEKEKQLDMALAKRQIRGVLDACPGGAVVVRLHLNAPIWWNRTHPEECVQYANGPVEDLPVGLPFNHEDGDILRGSRASLASQLWRVEAGKKLQEFCRSLARAREGKAVIGIHIAGGVYGEWHPWGFIKQEPDMSEPMQVAFRKWLKNKYGSDENLQTAWGSNQYKVANATVPDSNERRCCADGFFLDPASEQRVMDFYRCQQAVIADDIEFFCRIAKEHWGRPLITGVFYGYMQFGLCRQAMNGHLEARRLLQSPWIDYFAGPPSYYGPCRKAGGSGMQRAPIRSIQLHGKMWFDEIDNGYLQDKRERDFVRSDLLGDTNYLPLLQRSLWLPLVQNCGLWLYDFGPRRNTGWWDSPMYREEIKRSLHYFRSKYGRATKPESQAADALVVWDTESYYAVKNVNTKICEKGLDAAAEELQCSGVALDHIYLFDLQHIDLNNYKAIVFMNAWVLTPGQRQFIRDSVAQNGRTLIWNYGAGYSDGVRIGKALTEQVTGISLQHEKMERNPVWVMGRDTVENPEPLDPLLLVSDSGAVSLAALQDKGGVTIARKNFPNHTMVYAAVPLHRSAVFRELLLKAGCAVLNKAPDATFASSNHVVLHTGTGGKRILRLKNGKTLELELPKIATRLLDAGTGKEVLSDD